ncbi:MAG TPA: hypothetical protein VNB22_18305 [Pyrinomonadaceae bacterium]|jgi:hypothetical protein|nr:hypothetical protein [Pyrinomonadaceae bacterium]
MNRNVKIKVIKKNEVAITKPQIVTEKNLQESATREQASTVSDWVNEFQTRRCEEIRHAFDQLSAERLQTI